VFKDATGQITEGTQTVGLQGSALEIKGILDLDATGTDTNKPFGTQLSGATQSIAVDGHDVELAGSTVTHATGLPSWTWIVGAVGAVVVVPVLAIPALRRRRPSPHRRTGMEENLDDLLGIMQYPEALPVSSKLLDWAPEDPGAHFRHGKVLAHLGRPEEALHHHGKTRELLSSLHRENSVLAGENGYEAARAAVRLYEQATDAEKPRMRSVVLQWVREALQANPQILGDMQRQQELQPFVSEVLWGPQSSDGDVPYWLKP
jgi:tetratricopeptide (TPR) repeat protein